MSDSQIHDSSPDDVLRNPITDALRQLESKESNDEIEAALDTVDCEPLSDAAVDRILRQVKAARAATSVNGINVLVSTRHDNAHQRTRRTGQGVTKKPQSFIVVVCLSLLLLTGLIYRRSPVSRTDVASRTQNPLSKQLIGASPAVAEMKASKVPSRVKPGETITTGPREKRRFSLPDGSVLSMNEKTTVTVIGSRRIKLLAGEVFAEVIPTSMAGDFRAGDVKGRFVVETERRQVTALGTKFLVKADDVTTNVVVTQGKVQVSGVAPVIAAGQELIADEPQSTAVQVRPARRSAYVVQWVKDLMTAANSFTVPASHHSGGSITVIDPQGQEMKLSLRKFHVDVHIEDGFARTTIDQTYFNHTWQQLEGKFRFPLPADASLSRLAMYVNGTLMEGGMVERDYGRNVFEEIRHTRRDPALLEWVDGSTFQMRVFPLEARQEKRILLSYTQRLPGDYGKTSYRFPAGHNLEGVRDWSTHVRVKGAAGMKWYSPSHSLEGKSEGGDLVIDGQEQYAACDQDLVLELGDESPAVSRVTDPVWSRFNQDGFQYLMVRLRPELKQTGNRSRRHWVILFENSADRNTVLAETQRQVAKVLLENAEHSDQFSIVRAGTQPDVFRREPVDCSLDNIEGAMQFLREVSPIGALDLGQSLQLIQQMVRPGVETYVVHLGTGIPVLGERDQTTLTRQIPSSAHYVGVAVGKRWSKSFMESAAKRTNGLVVQINPDEAVAWRAFDLLSTLNAPRLTEICVTPDEVLSQIPKAAGVEFLPMMTSLSHGQEFVAVTRVPIDQPLPRSITISGRVDGQAYSNTLPIPLVIGTNIPETSHAATNSSPVVVRSGHLPRTWARLEIDRLVSLGADEHKSRIIDLSKSMYVMSPFTSLLVLETEAMYSQYNVDRGRKDHWAMYDAPVQIPVIMEPTAVQVTALDAAKERLKQAERHAESAGKNLDRALADGRPATDIMRLERVKQFELRDVQILKEEIRRIEELNAAAEDPVKKAWDSVIQRHSLWQRGYVQPAYWSRVPLGWSDARLNWNDPSVIPSFSQQSTWGLTSNFDWYFWGETPDLHGNPIRRSTSNRNRTFFGNTNGRSPGPMINGPGPGLLQPIPFAPGDRISNTHLWAITGSLEGIDRRGLGIDTSSLLSNEYRWRGRFPTGEPVVTVPLDVRKGFVGQNTFQWSLQDLPEDRSGPVSFIDGNGVGMGGFGGQNLPFHSASGQGLQSTGAFSLLGRFGLPSNGIVRLSDLNDPVDSNWDSDRLVQLNQRIDSFVPMPQITSFRFVNGLDDASRAAALPHDVGFPAGWFGRIPQGMYDVQPWGGSWGLQGAPSPLTQVIKDLPSYAPGLYTWTSDRLAVAEQASTTKSASGTVDAEARRLIDKARSLGWQTIRLMTVNGKPVSQADTVTADGTGRLRLDREVSEGLKETILNDGRQLWHLYPEIGLGARRTLCRAYAPAIQSLIPWYVPDAQQLALNADVRMAGERTIRIQTIATDKRLFQQTLQAKGTGSDSDQVSSAATSIVVELVFADGGPLTELRVIDGAKNGILSRQVISAEGKIQLFGMHDQIVSEAQYEVLPVDSPDLSPATDGLVVLPLPYRSSASVGVEVPLNLQNNAPDYTRLSDDDAMKLLATYFAEGRQSELVGFIDQRFRSRGDKRIGFLVLLSSGLPANMTSNAGFQDPDTPLSRFLEQAASLVPISNLNGYMNAGPGAPAFLQRLCDAYNHYARWSSGRADATDRSDADVQQELAQTLNYVKDCRSLDLASTLLLTIHQRLNSSGRMNATYARQLNATAGAIAMDRDRPDFVRSARIEWSLTVGTPEFEEEANRLLRAQLLEAVEFGVAPVLDTGIHLAFVKHFHTPDDQSCLPWAQAVRDASMAISKLSRSKQLIALACQCVGLNESALAAEIARLATRDQDLHAIPELNLLLLEYAKLAKDWTLAQVCVERALSKAEYQQNSNLWRDAATISHQQQKYADWIERLTKAYEIEFAALPQAINLQAFRQDYDALFLQLEQRADQLIEASAEERKSFSIAVQRAATRWREIDSDDTNVCHRTARMLTKLGQASAAWNYWTTPLAESPDSSNAWTSFATAMQSENRFAVADRAWLTAASCEPTNPEILLQHAQFLKRSKQETRANGMLRAIIDGNWQPRFAGTKTQAQAILSGQ